MLFHKTGIDKKSRGAAIEEGVNVQFFVSVNSHESKVNIERMGGFEQANIEWSGGRGFCFYFGWGVNRFRWRDYI